MQLSAAAALPLAASSRVTATPNGHWRHGGFAEAMPNGVDHNLRRVSYVTVFIHQKIHIWRNAQRTENINCTSHVQSIFCSSQYSVSSARDISGYACRSLCSISAIADRFWQTLQYIGRLYQNSAIYRATVPKFCNISADCTKILRYIGRLYQNSAIYRPTVPKFCNISASSHLTPSSSGQACFNYGRWSRGDDGEYNEQRNGCYRPDDTSKSTWNRPGQALSFRHPGFLEIGTWRWKCQPYAPAVFTLQEVLNSVTGWVDHMAMVRPEGLCQWKTVMTHRE